MIVQWPSIARVLGNSEAAAAMSQVDGFFPDTRKDEVWDFFRKPLGRTVSNLHVSNDAFVSSKVMEKKNEKG